MLQYMFIVLSPRSFDVWSGVSCKEIMFGGSWPTVAIEKGTSFAIC